MHKVLSSLRTTRTIWKHYHRSARGTIRNRAKATSTSSQSVKTKRERSQTKTNDILPLSNFVQSNTQPQEASNYDETLLKQQIQNEETEELKFHLKTYGCQMNVSDSDIVRSVLLSNSSNISFIETFDEEQADILLTNTCAIRDNAEAKVWHRLKSLRALDKKSPSPKIIGVLGCMAERLKDDMFRHSTVDFIAGPDAYRDVPRLISLLRLQGSKAMNVQLSLDETYADIRPVRRSSGEKSAFVSVMRGCNNMCSYCIVPFTRGRERSRDYGSVLEEVRCLVEEGVKEVVLLGQNVNSYHIQSSSFSGQYTTSNDGFRNMYKRGGPGYYFSDLVAAVSDISPELRVRFTSPHPKDYPPSLLQLMAERDNVCNQIHIPAQSGSTSTLKRMRRGYSREAYLKLIQDVWDTIPDIALSSDFITGFCGETEEEHRDTLSLMRFVRYDQAFMFAYSMRERTNAHRTMEDDVPQDVKLRRLAEVIDVFRTTIQDKNSSEEIGKLRLVLLEGPSKRKREYWTGRTDQNKRILFPLDNIFANDFPTSFRDDPVRVSPEPGDYVVVMVTEAKGHTLRGRALWRTTLKEFSEVDSMVLDSVGDWFNKKFEGDDGSRAVS